MKLNILLFPVLITGSAYAQSAATVGFPRAGAHIKLELPALGARQYGTLISADKDTIVFTPEETEFRIALPTTQVARMEVSLGKDRHVLTDALTGLLITGGTVAAVAAITWKPEGDFYFTRGATAAILGVPAGILGGIIGGVIGAIPRDIWARVPIPRD